MADTLAEVSTGFLPVAGAGQPARARIVFERLAAFVNDVGLLAEEVDPVSGQLLGNFPQAFSLIGFVNAAWPFLRPNSDRNHPLRMAPAPHPARTRTGRPNCRVDRR